MQQVLVGLGYVLDVLRWVPYVGVLVGGYRLAGGTLDDPRYIGCAAAEVGPDYQLSTYPSYTTVMLRLGIHVGLLTSAPLGDRACRPTPPTATLVW